MVTGNEGPPLPRAGEEDISRSRLYAAWRAARSLPVSLALALILTMFFFFNRQDILRHLFQVFLVWIPLVVLLNLPLLLRSWKKVLVFVGACALLMAGLWLGGPFFVERVALPTIHLDVDHRPKPVQGLTNEDGVMPDSPANSYQEKDFNIIFLGDSFTQGQAVSQGDTFPVQVEQAIRARRPDFPIRTINFGWPSSSPLLQLRQLRQIGAKYKPDLVVTSFDMTDFADDLKYTELLKEEQGYTLKPTIFQLMLTALSLSLGVMDLKAWLAQQTTLDVEPEEDPSRPWLKQRFFHMYRPLSQTEHLLETSWKVLLETHRTVEKMGARYVVFILPRYQQYNRKESPRDWEKDQFPKSDTYIHEPFKYFDKKTKEAPFPIYPLIAAFQDSDVFPTTWTDDPHYTPAGNRVVAEAMARYLKESSLLP